MHEKIPHINYYSFSFLISKINQGNKLNQKLNIMAIDTKQNQYICMAQENKSFIITKRKILNNNNTKLLTCKKREEFAPLYRKDINLPIEEKYLMRDGLLHLFAFLSPYF